MTTLPAPAVHPRSEDAPARVRRTPSRPGRRLVRRRLLEAGVAVNLGVFLLTGGLHAQETYYRNPGENDAPDSGLGEMGPDLGALIPFDRYQETDHYWQRILMFNVFGPMRDHVTDLDQLHTALFQATGQGVHLDVTADPDWHSSALPVQRVTWWGRDVDVWKYDINGGKVLLVRQALDEIAMDRGEVHLLVHNMSQHDSDMGTQAPRNDFDPDPQNFLLQGYSRFPWEVDSSSNPILDTTAQAVEAGDLVVFILEERSLDLWSALLRTSEAVRFIHQTFFSQEISGDPRFSNLTLGQAVIRGGSWGAVMAGVLALLQPKIYSASTNCFINDIGLTQLGIGDYGLLQRTHYLGAAGVGYPETALANRYLLGWPILIDLLGLRFDAVQGTTNWDVAAFSLTHRAAELQTPFEYSPIGMEDPIGNWHWQRDDTGVNGRVATYLRNYDHAPLYGNIPGWFEFLHCAPNEWDQIVGNLSGPATSNPPVSPSFLSSPQYPSVAPYPDPYGHTLRRGNSAPLPAPLLTEMDINVETHDVLSLGQGVWPGNLDSMQAVDLDDDGTHELIFGNLEGYVHVLEPREILAGVAGWRLVDEWKSPRLGWGTWSILDPEGSSNTLRIADHSGYLWEMQSSNFNTYSIQSAPWAAPDVPRRHYPGPITQMVEAELQGLGQETALLTQHLDWVVRSSSGGNPQPIMRSTESAVPGRAVACNIDGLGDEEILVPGMNGHLGRIYFNSLSQKVLFEVLEDSYTDRCLYRAEVIDLGGTEKLLVFGRNDDLSQPDVLRLYDLGPLTFQSEHALDVDLRHMSYARMANTSWIAVGGGSRVQLVDVSTPTPQTPQQIFPEPEDTARQISSLCWLPMPPPAGTTQGGLLAVAVGDGRIYLYDWDGAGGLSPFRTAQQALGAGASPSVAWYSNRSLGHCAAVDVVPPNANDDAFVHAAEFNQPFDAAGNQHRVLKLKVPLGKKVKPVHITENPESLGIQVLPKGHRFMHRAFRYEDLDGDGTREPRSTAASGAFLTEESTVRTFCNRRGDDGEFAFNDPQGTWAPFWRNFGGFVWERVEDPSVQPGGYRYFRLSGFDVPADQSFGSYLYNSGQGYPRQGTVPAGGTGKIASGASERWLQFYDGSSMTTAELPDPNASGQIAEHIVTGTLGGYVYAIRPGEIADRILPAAGPQDAELPSSLSYASECLGLRVIGLDAGKLRDSDPYDSVVVGTWLDDGTFADWVAGDPNQNRGELILLELSTGVPTSLMAVKTVLNGDCLAGVGGGLSSGVFGVKLDDVDGDSEGKREIWCGDAAGHLYLFRQTGSGWACAFRSESYGAYIGMYNKIFPVKNEFGHTVELIVKSPGYLHRFAVDHSVLNLGGQ